MANRIGVIVPLAREPEEAAALTDAAVGLAISTRRFVQLGAGGSWLFGGIATVGCVAHA